MLEAWAAHDVSLYRSFGEMLRGFGKSLASSRVLDIGCGANAPMTIMLHSAGGPVVGIDESVGYRWGLGFRPARYRDYLREAGLRRTVRKAVGELVYDRRYYAGLSRMLGFSLTEKGIDLREMRTEALRFGDAEFDVVYSNATWEHVRDVATANQEVARVLRPGGIALIEIHLFPSLSGGHDLPWIVPGKTILGDVAPWRHLRDPSWVPGVYLNRLRERDFQHLFHAVEELDVIGWHTEFTEGEDLVTEQILSELRDYTREELTKRSIVVTLRRKP